MRFALRCKVQIQGDDKSVPREWSVTHQISFRSNQPWGSRLPVLAENLWCLGAAWKWLAKNLPILGEENLIHGVGSHGKSFPRLNRMLDFLGCDPIGIS